MANPNRLSYNTNCQLRPAGKSGSSVSRKPVGGRLSNLRGPVGQPSLATLSASEANGQADSLAREADLLVQELGLIQTRKKALVGIASVQGVRPGQLSGSREDDYRDLLAREARIRTRLEEIDSGRTSGSL